MNKKYNLKLEQLNILSKDIIENFKNGVVILRGDLASGKTTLVKNIALELGVKDEVTSPTFSLQQCYSHNIYHYDIYNHGLEHFISLGMLEELEKDGLHFIEWGDEKLQNILTSVGIAVMLVEIEKTSNDEREYKVCIL
ncbi:MAG: tRNA (adenosine(37)-N6)-threonylcarbamoyltransferase complex ATPase subunit type 1 TsaE [Campylobacterota bacterium]|nr:tRNA (adenosine(37)-N6)-threonylcarbamoyltransferase complex ATPase subunit type 1 TsaE [Campylobacterota bacterium]